MNKNNERLDKNISDILMDLDEDSLKAFSSVVNPKLISDIKPKSQYKDDFVTNLDEHIALKQEILAEKIKSSGNNKNKI